MYVSILLLAQMEQVGEKVASIIVNQNCFSLTISSAYFTPVGFLPSPPTGKGKVYR